MSRVLVLDDDADIATMVKMILELHGFVCEYILNHKELESKLFSYSPDLLIIDIALSGADGRNICKQVKEKKESSHVPVILFSANTNLPQEYKDCKAEAFISKPFDTNELIETVKKFI